jgi:hypothetical protein
MRLLHNAPRLRYLKKRIAAADFFRRMPVAVARSDLARKLRLRSGEPSAYAAFLGSVPGEETDEEFAAAVEELS